MMMEVMILPDDEENPETRNISINVVDSDNEPISEASVAIGDVIRTTGSAGGCSFSDIEDGTVSVTISRDGYFEKTEEIVVDAEHTEFSFSLELSLRYTINVLWDDGTKPGVNTLINLTVDNVYTAFARGGSVNINLPPKESYNIHVEIQNEGNCDFDNVIPNDRREMTIKTPY